MKLKVLACAFACSPGGGSARSGAGEFVLGWNVVRQIGRFHQVWVLTAAQNRPGIEAGLKEEMLPGASFHYIGLHPWLERLQWFRGGIQFYGYLWQVKAYFVARRLHREFRFDLFHHVTYANDWMASFIGASLPVPYIRGPGGGSDRTPAGFLSEYSLRDRVWERFRTIGQWLLRRDPFFILGQRRARAILVCTPKALESIPQQWRNKAQLFPVNGVTSSELAPSCSAGEPGKSFQVLSAGKLIHWKGFGLAVKSFGAFAARHPEATFTIAGDGPELPRLEGLVRELKLQGRVRFERWLARDELFSRMRSCDVFLYPSLRDGGGGVVVEAMAAGKPVICMDLAGPGMHVTDGCGIKIIPQSPEQAATDLASALECLYTNRELRLRMGTAARVRAEHVYHWERLGERLLEVYREASGIGPAGV